MPSSKFRNKQRTGNVGLFYICYRLSRLGWIAMPTIKNAKGIDIVAYSENGGEMLTIQTKGFTDSQSISFQTKDDVIADFYIIATQVYEHPPIVYILTKDEVKDHLVPYKDKFWVDKRIYQPKKKSKNNYGQDLSQQFVETWGKVGFGFANDKEREHIVKFDNGLVEKKNREER